MNLSESLRVWIPWIFAGVIIIGYALFIFLLVNKTSTKDDEWVRLIHIFTSVEAIVFVAIGFIFGKEVNRSIAINAERKQEKAQQDKRVFAREILSKLSLDTSASQPTNLDLGRLNEIKEMAEKVCVD